MFAKILSMIGLGNKNEPETIRTFLDTEREIARAGSILKTIQEWEHVKTLYKFEELVRDLTVIRDLLEELEQRGDLQKYFEKSGEEILEAKINYLNNFLKRFNFFLANLVYEFSSFIERVKKENGSNFDALEELLRRSNSTNTDDLPNFIDEIEREYKE